MGLNTKAMARMGNGSAGGFVGFVKSLYDGAEEAAAARASATLTWHAEDGDMDAEDGQWVPFITIGVRDLSETSE